VATNEPLVALPTYSEAFGPNKMPLGLIKKRLTLELDVAIEPSIKEGEPPVTRERIFLILAVLWKIATSPVLRLNCKKLWNRLLPTV
jgi:hypothetical protein